MSRLAYLATFVVWLGPIEAGSGAPPQEYRFTYRPLAVGDAAHETLRFTIDLKTVRSQGGEVVDVNDQAAVREEQSLVVRLDPDPGQSAKVRLTYEQSQQSTQPRSGTVQSSDRPVAGKTYLAARQGEDLLIADERGLAPPDEEREIVARTLESLGKPNPLGVFFNGRSMRVGERVQLPADYTQKLLAAWDPAFSKEPLEVMLMGTERVDGQLCALLHTPPAAAGGRRNPVEGKFLIELATCRPAVVELRGPVNSSEQRGEPGQEFDVRRKGKLQVAVHVEHRRAAR
ncbi:MAG TPA: hypothetical protein VHD36_22475 [Pirellulales bacterium]|nr:hypothetical protein [Pirellulales bacterium]